MHSKPGSKAAQKRAELRSCPLQPGKSDEARCRVPVLAVQVLVPVLVAIVVVVAVVAALYAGVVVVVCGRSSRRCNREQE